MNRIRYYSVIERCGKVPQSTGTLLIAAKYTLLVLGIYLYNSTGGNIRASLLAPPSPFAGNISYRTLYFGRTNHSTRVHCDSLIVVQQ